MTHIGKFLLAAAVVILPCVPVQAASLSLVFDTPSVVAFPGDTLIFSGSVTNLENLVVDLNSCSVNLPGFSNTSYNCDIFFDPFVGAPFTLNANGTAGDTAHFSMFTVNVDSPWTGAFGVPFGGAYTITGGIEFPAGVSPDTILGEANFAVTVAPEPGTFALLALALPLAAVLKRRVSRSCTS